LNEFRRAIEKQFTWNCPDPLPFITLFSDERHAENWGRKEPWRGHKGPEGNWALYVVDTVELRKTTHLFRLSDLVEKLSLDIPEGAEQHIQGAFICLHRIPASAIIEQRTPAEIEEGKYTDVNVGRLSVWLIADRECERLDARDTGDYLEEYSGSEYEAMQENYDTIFEKNIENNW
jgi:hypothetical protein